jgi:hypothetical protein
MNRNVAAFAVQSDVIDSPRFKEADCETLWAMVQDQAARSSNPVPKMLLEKANVEHWTVQHTALALAYVLMQQEK